MASGARKEAMRQAAKFKIGQRVTFTNDYGAMFPGKTIVFIEIIDFRPRYYVTPTDCPWYPKHEENLSLE